MNRARMLTPRISRWVTALACAFATMGAAAGAVPAGKPVASDSVYQLPVPLVDQNGATSQLADRRGQPLLITMFYSNCQFVCPRIIEALKRTEAALTPGERRRAPVIAVTFDPARDDPAALKGVADEHHLDPAQWTLARTDTGSVRKLAATLGIQYRALPSGEFNHTSVLILLDGEGRIVGRTFTIGAADPVFVKLVKKTLAASIPRVAKQAREGVPAVIPEPARE